MKYNEITRRTVKGMGLWQEGTVKVGDSWYRYCVKAYDEPSGKPLHQHHQEEELMTLFHSHFLEK